MGTKKSATKNAPPSYWSKDVTEPSNALDLEKGVSLQKDPKKMVESIKRSASQCNRIEAGSFQSAISMINFFENRDGTNISEILPGF